MQNSKIKHSIAIELFKVLFTIYIILTVIMTSMHMYAEYQYAQKSIKNEIILLEKTFKQPLIESIWNFDEKQREILLNSIYNLKFITGIELISKDNITIFTMGDTNKKDEMVYSFHLIKHFNTNSILLGNINLYTKSSVILDRVKIGFYFIIFNVILSSIALWILLMWAVNKYLAKPINSLTLKVQNIDFNNIDSCELLNYQNNKYSQNEIDLFSKSFSLMLNKINVSIKELDALNKTLDLKVIAQTKELHSEKQYIQTILDTNPNMIIVTNGMNIITANERFFEFFQYKTIEDFKIDHDCVCDYFITLDDDIFPTSKNIQGKNWCNYLASHSDSTHLVQISNFNTNYYFSINVNYMNSKEMLITMQDITELKHKDQLLLQQSKLASMGEMIGNIAHQWRQPLSAISTAATGIQVQKEYGLLTDELLETHCNSININAQYLSKTIDDFKNFIKGDRDKKLFNINNSITSFLDLVEGTIKKYNINIIINIENDIEITGYENELIQCLINIFNNAKDALLELEEEERFLFILAKIKNNYLEMSIKDNAGGIEDQILPKIFEPYFTTKHKSQGTGLGLHMTYTLITKGMNGTIEARNTSFKYNDKEYKGALFLISLPLI